MGTGIKRGIIQSRGLGDIIIALPIARHYWEAGDEIHWPVCEEFYTSVVDSVPWVKWYSIPADAQGRFFLETPLQVFAANGVDPEEALYLYHYLNTVPERTDPEYFNILKFDQYKYQISGVAFRNKWSLSYCITRDPVREESLRSALNIGPGERYALVSLKGSNFEARIDLGWLDPAVRIIDVDAHATDSIFDWIGLLESAEAIVCVDSAFANMTDQLTIEGPTLYWLRRSPWDLTPVLGCSWLFVPTNLPITEPTRVDPAAEAAKKAGKSAAGLVSHAPYSAAGQIPTSFMGALNGGRGQAASRPNAAQSLLAGLGKQ